MKKILIASFFFITNITFGLGQFGYNASSGIAISKNVFNINSTSTGYLEEYFIQLSPNYTLNQILSFSINLQYIGKGSEDGRVKFRSTYLEALPELEYSIINKLLIAFGFNYGILLKFENQIDNKAWTDVREITNFPFYDIGLSARIQGEYKNIIIFGRYIHGLKDLTDVSMIDQFGNFVGDVDYYNRTYQIGIGYKFL